RRWRGRPPPLRGGAQRPGAAAGARTGRPLEGVPAEAREWARRTREPRRALLRRRAAPQGLLRATPGPGRRAQAARSAAPPTAETAAPGYACERARWDCPTRTGASPRAAGRG